MLYLFFQTLHMYTKEHIRIYLSLSALLFFAPFVQHLLHTTTLAIDEDDKKFISGYVYLGFLIITATLCLIGIYILNVFREMPLLTYIYTYGIYPLIGTIGTGVFLVFSNKSIFQPKSIAPRENVQEDTAKILVSFLPIYNFYLRYAEEEHKKQQPSRRIKESILLRSIFAVYIILGNNDVGNNFILLAIIVRVVSLLGNIDLVREEIKKKINGLFFTNTEEIWCFARGYVLFAWHRFKGTAVHDTAEKYIQEEQKKYKELYTITKENILLIVQNFLLLLIGLRYTIHYTSGSYYWGIYNVFIYFGLSIVIAKHAILLVKGKILRIPILDEITTIGGYMLGFFGKQLEDMKSKGFQHKL